MSITYTKGHETKKADYPKVNTIHEIKENKSHKNYGANKYKFWRLHSGPLNMKVQTLNLPTKTNRPRIT